jgi:hypothetical protein
MQKLLIISVLLVLFAAGSVDAQNLRRTYGNFRKLELYAARVADIVQRFQDRRAAELVQKAQIEIEAARTALFSTNPPVVMLAQVSMLKAKRYLDQAAGIVLEKPFGNLKLQLDDLINRAERAVMQINNDEANYLLDQSKRFRRRAYESYNSGNPVKAQEFYRISYFFAKKCIDYTANQNKDAADQLIELETSVQQMMDQGAELLRNQQNSYLESQLSDARKYYEEALEMADRGETDHAIKRLRLIKRLLYRMYNQVDQSGAEGNDRIADDLFSLQGYLESLAENTDLADRPEARNMLDQAQKFYLEAEQAYNDGDLTVSAQKIALSQRIASQLFRFHKKDQNIDPATLRIQLDETRQVLQMQEQSVRDSGSSTAEKLWRDAGQILDRAESALTAGRNTSAFQRIQAATRMAVRLQKVLKHSAEPEVQGDMVNRYMQIKTMIDRMRQNEDLDQDAGPVLQQIMEFAETGKTYLDRGDTVPADEYLNTAEEQLKQFSARWRKKVTE